MAIVTVNFDKGSKTTNIRVPEKNPAAIEYSGDPEPWKNLEREKYIINKAAKKLYGKRCFWLENYGLDGYGQVFEALKPTKRNSNPGNSSVTNQIFVSITE